MGEKRQQAVTKEVTKLLAVGFIRHVECPEWMTNPVLVKKSNSDWRMCIDYTDLNKACPMVNKVFQEQIGRNVEAYVDDLLVKSMTDSGHVEDLKKTFATLNRADMKLNPKKIFFGLTGGKFLGFMVSMRGIEIHPSKSQAIFDMKPPENLKELQSLTGRLATLNRFIARS
jgi:hypothetical protein